MDNSLLLLYINYFKLIPFIIRLLSLRFNRLSGFISIVYLIILTKWKLQLAYVKPVDIKQFRNLLKQNKYYFDHQEDIYSYVLVSINTLIALSIRNTSWIKISKLLSDDKDSKTPSHLVWNIKIPPVKDDQNVKNVDDNYYYVQCLCLSSIKEDFTLFMTEEKLFNLSKLKSEENNYNDVINTVSIQKVNSNLSITIATSAVVAPISSSCDIIFCDYEYILEQYFSKPKLLRVRDVFKIGLKDYINYLQSNFLELDYIYFKVIKLSGNPPDNELYYILKDRTSLYLNPPDHGFLPQKRSIYLDSNKLDCYKVISCCPDGLRKQFVYLQKLFWPFLKINDMTIKPIFLLLGPVGSGKKSTIRAIGNFFGLHLIRANCFDFYGLNPSLTKGKIQQIFAQVRRTLPCVLYLENIELLGREQNCNENMRLVDIFITQLEELWRRKSFAYPMFIVGSTSDKSMDIVPAIARLFVETVTFKAIEKEDSIKMLKWLLDKQKLTCSSEMLIKIGEKCKGYVYGDFELLVKHALSAQLEGNSSINNEERELSLKSFEKAIEIMDAAYSDSIGAARVPCVQWEDIGGLSDIKDEVILTLEHPSLFNSELKRSGIIFYGPPGTGKTLMAKAIATECNYNFLSVKGPELMNMYVGESEKNVREVFERARDAAPCIIFFDELDALAPCRGKSGDSGNVVDRVVSQFLTELDGLDENYNLFVLGATNRPDLVDPALFRPGRFDKMFYVGVCNDNESKLSVLKALTRRFLLSADVNLERVAEKLPNKISGADLYSVASNAWFSAARKSVDNIEKGVEISLPLVVHAEDFQNAIEQFEPSLSDDNLQYYERLNSSKSS